MEEISWRGEFDKKFDFYIKEPLYAEENLVRREEIKAFIQSQLEKVIEQTGTTGHRLDTNEGLLAYKTALRMKWGLE